MVWRIAKAEARARSEPDKKAEAQRHRSMSWAQRLKRVFRIDSARFRFRCYA
jgi:hypothetical protein